ncbi:MAG: cell wall hydrolase [Fulvimarina manganoxydans]|uniref:cell wall hydrolase n=1 Tax=Fulvimarina manganoxydans TaxID=937218 RepID=UPI002357862C|nr:cell wall hydrolase [Fulvimarina manganoxydans]MCK5933876.1 cell wall hydrolase [Fulvimarina manganoxydans]
MTTTIFSLRAAATAGVLVSTLLASGCMGSRSPVEEVLASVNPDERECLARAMYFESNRSSEAGMMAVGTVVMNRVESSAFPNDVCAVVGQPRQFAPGVMTREMNAGRELAMATAAKVLRGERAENVREAKFFHTAGYNFSYPNMHYVAIVGGNAFYEKIGKSLRSRARLATQADVAAGKTSFDFAALREEERGGARGATSALALDAAEKAPARSPFKSLLDGLTGQQAATEPQKAPAASAANLADANEPDPARFGDLPGVSGAGIAE